MNEFIHTIGFLIVAPIFILTSKYRKRKKKEYANDERWNKIESNALNIIDRSDEIIYYAFFLIFILLNGLMEINISFTLQEVIALAIIYYALKDLIRFIALKFYDKRL